MGTRTSVTGLRKLPRRPVVDPQRTGGTSWYPPFSTNCGSRPIHHPGSMAKLFQSDVRVRSMNPADFPDKMRERCLLCGRQPKEVREDSSRDICHVVCDVCGRYGITDTLFWAARSGEVPSDMGPCLSAVVRRQFVFTHRPEVLTSANWRELASQAPDMSDVTGKVGYLVDYIARRSRFPGDKVTLTSLIDYPLCFATNKDEFEFYIRHAVDEGFVEEHDSGTHVQCEVSLTTKGWEETRRIARVASHGSNAGSGSGTSCPQSKIPTIFISYRRADSAYPSQYIYDTLVSHFGKDCVFFDVDTIPPGQDFHAILADSVGKCDLLLAVVGDHWLTALDDAGQRRIDSPDDFVRIEIEAALSRNIPVIPVLVGQASVPVPDALPPSLRGLVKKQATEVRPGRDLQSHLGRLVRDIEQAAGTADSSDRAVAHSIRFNVDDWTVWQEPSYDPNDAVVVISQWRGGDTRYSCSIRLRNDLGWDDELHRLRMEFRQGDNVLLEDTYAFADTSVVLPPRKWISINVSYGVHEEGVFASSDSVWFVAETVGDNSKVAWLIAHISPTG